ncbi:MAG: prepilin-type N-terminal cleavage/methylation domain-containing protein [Planctomycetota bacterium]|nr:MAG: prepilin-type N-terminal cleavage/methylation domain-containing protein [Planctomycetota bacterium]
MKLKNRGFSLTEVLLSVGVLAVGMIFIAGVFPVGIHYTTIAIEQTKAAIVADEAFAKIRLYAVGNPSRLIDLSKLHTDELGPYRSVEFEDIFPAAEEIDPNEFTYPSAGTDISEKRYCWWALCRVTTEYHPISNPNPDVQVTVFVCRKVGRNLKYPEPPEGRGEISWPRPVKVGVEDAGAKDTLRIRPRPGASGDERFINDGSIIVDDRTGRIYRVLERYADEPDTILLDKDWDDTPPGDSPRIVWVVPPPVGGGRNPCIAVYQRTMSF